MQMPVDLRLYALVDPEHAGGRDLARAGAPGGARRRDAGAAARQAQRTRAMVERARAIKAALAPFGVPLLINDRVDVALASGADGVHVGQDDMAAADARRLLGPEAIIGLSIKTMPQAEAAPFELLDYVGGRRRVPDNVEGQPKPPIGAEGFGADRRHIPRPGAGISALRALPASTPSNAARCDRGRRRRHRCDFGVVVGARSAGGRARSCAASWIRAGKAGGDAMTTRSPSPSPARIPAAAPASRPISRRFRRSASMARR